MKPMSSKERITGLLRGEAIDRIPLCFEGICHGVRPLVSDRYPDPFDRALYYLDRGIDTAVSIEPPTTSKHGFTGRQWLEQPGSGEAPDARYPVFHRTYETARGTLEQIVYKTADYPEQINLFSDFNVPASRSIRHLVMGPADLDVLEEILKPPESDELAAFTEAAEQSRNFCKNNEVMLRGTLWGVGDPLFWLSGVERVLTSAMDDPEFIDRYVDIIARLSQKRLELLIDSGVDLVVRRGWYECADFWSPGLFERFLYPPLKREIETAHEAGVHYVYVMNSGYAPYLDMLRSLEIDVLSNIDAVTGKISHKDLRDRVADDYVLCGGVNNFEVIERGSESDVVAAVRAAIDDLGGGRFILAPGDSILSRSETAARNLETMIETWASSNAVKV